MESGNAAFKKLKVQELKDILQKNSLPVQGKKEELITRLIENNIPPPTPIQEEKPTAAIEKKPEEALIKQQKPDNEAASPQETEVPLAPENTNEEKTNGTSNIDPDLEKMKKRAERFGVVVSEEVKKKERALKFGASEQQSKAPIDEGVLKKRQDRFGVVAPKESTKIASNVSQEELEKRKARAERFKMSSENDAKRMKTS